MGQYQALSGAPQEGGMDRDLSCTGGTETGLMAKLRANPRLGESRAFIGPVACKICGAPSPFFDRVDFNKFCNEGDYYEYGLAGVPVDYHRCGQCGFLFTTFCDTWSADDFRAFIYNADYAKVDSEYAEIRPSHVAANMAQRLAGAENARILDYGSGAGVFVQRMHDHGFHDIQAYDPFSSPERPEGRFDIITCFEVVEHTTDPKATLLDMTNLLEPDGSILLSQTLQPANIMSSRGSWWYLGPRNGHVSTYTEEAFETLGRELGLFFHRGDTVYAFAGSHPSAHAALVLASVGPSFSTVRLSAPHAPRTAIVEPADERVLWHRLESGKAGPFRWTGEHRLFQWRANWPPVRRIRVHLPLVREVTHGFAAACTLSLDGEVAEVALVRGDLTAEFDVADKRQGLIELRTPAAVRAPAEAGRAVGIAVTATAA